MLQHENDIGPTAVIYNKLYGYSMHNALSQNNPLTLLKLQEPYNQYKAGIDHMWALCAILVALNL